MKTLKYLLIICLCSLFSSCDNMKYGDIFKVTDDYVENLYLYKGSGSLFDLTGVEKYTKDGNVRVQSVGKLIIVKYEKYVEDKEYEELEKALSKRYKNKSSVRDVYRNQGGTICIDCRR